MRYNCRFQLSSTFEVRSGQAISSQPEAQHWSHLSPSFRRSRKIRCAARPATIHLTTHATTAGPARSTRIVRTAPTAPTAARCFQRAARPATIHLTTHATTAALARSTRIVRTAPTAPTAARGPHGFHRHRPRLASAQRRAAIALMPRMAFVTTAALARSTRIVRTAPTAPTAVPAPQEAPRRPLPLPPGRRRPAPML